MSCEQHGGALGDYVDGTPARSGDRHDREALAALESHLARCTRCSAVVADLRAIRAAARALPPYEPPPHVWPAISAATADRAHTANRAHTRVVTYRRLQLAAAAVVVALIGVWAAWQRGSPPPAGMFEPAPVGEVAADGAGADEFGGDVEAAEADYVLAIDNLEQITAAERAALDEETAAVVQANLVLLDEAIDESRAAVDAAPFDDVAQESLFEALRSKVMLLRNTVALINEMRQGDQEGAARVVSELNP